MPRKTPDEIFTVIKKYEPDRRTEVMALQVVLEASKKRQQKRQEQNEKEVAS